MNQFKVNLAGVELEHPVMNAAGTCKTLDDVKRLARSNVAAIVVGSITKEARTGNTGTTYWSGSEYALNSLGLPNPGSKAYKEMLPEMVKIAHDAGKPLFVSVAGFSAMEYVDLTELALEAEADLVEMNLGCPNVLHEGVQKPIFSFAPFEVERIVQLVKRRVDPNARIGVKVSPFSDPVALQYLATIISGSELVKFLTTTNTFPNAYESEGGKARITPNNGLAGLSGAPMRPIGLGQVVQLRRALPEHIQIIGVGGISSADHVREYLSAGATAVQVATAYLERREQVFTDILTELTEKTEG